MICQVVFYNVRSFKEKQDKCKFDHGVLKSQKVYVRRFSVIDNVVMFRFHPMTIQALI